MNDTDVQINDRITQSTFYGGSYVGRKRCMGNEGSQF